ncbi:hypothetical protein D3C77_776500 [compost metagenome]
MAGLVDAELILACDQRIDRFQAGFDIAHQHRTAAGLLLDIAGKALGQLQVLVQVGEQTTQLRATAA